MLMHFDVFNGDADGICSLLQLRLETPLESELVTGVKRDISLLDKVVAQSGDRVTVLDVSMAKNQEALRRLLQSGVEVDYIDHHDPGDIPDHPLLTHTISEAPEVCTALLVNGRLRGRQVDWAVAGAFGDNLRGPAHTLAQKSGFSDSYTAQLERLGTFLNYNGYGPSLEDLHCPPDQLYRLLYAAQTPPAFAASDTFVALRDGYEEDLAASAELAPSFERDGFAVYHLPNAPWARRVSGVFSNQLVNAHPDRAHAVLTDQGDDEFLVSIRAPLVHRHGALAVCRQFETGGGREAAAGINRLPHSELDRLIEAMTAQYSGRR